MVVESTLTSDTSGWGNHRSVLLITVPTWVCKLDNESKLQIAFARFPNIPTTEPTSYYSKNPSTTNGQLANGYVASQRQKTRPSSG